MTVLLFITLLGTTMIGPIQTNQKHWVTCL